MWGERSTFDIRRIKPDAKHLLALNQPGFEEAVVKLRKEWNGDNEGKFIRLKNTNNGNSESEKYFIYNEKLQRDVTKLVSKFRVPHLLYEVLKYVVSGKKNPMGWWSAGGDQPDDGSNFFILKIDEKTTIADIKRVWPKIKKMMGVVKTTKKQPWTNYQRDEHIFRLHQGGKTTVEIMNAVQTEFQQDMDLGNIKTIVSRFYDELKTPRSMRKKLKLE